MTPPISAANAQSIAVAWGSDPIGRLLPNELKAQVYSHLRAKDCLELALTNKYHFFADTELWSRIAQPVRRVPLNAVELWNARQAQNARKIQYAEVASKQFEDMQDAVYGWLAATLAGLLCGVVGGSIALATRVHSQNGVEPEAPLPLFIGMGVGIFTGITLGAAFFVYEYETKTRLLDALARPLDMPAMKFATQEELARSPEEVRRWRKELAPLRREMCSLFYHPTSDTSPGSELEFLVNELRLPFSLLAALDSGRPSLVARSIKTLPYLCTRDLKDVLDEVKFWRPSWRIHMVRIALNRTAPDDFRELFARPIVWKSWAANDFNAPVLDLLLRQLNPVERAATINDVSANAHGESIFHYAADMSNVSAFRVLLKHGGNLQLRDAHSGSTVRQVALRRHALRSEPWLTPRT